MLSRSALAAIWGYQRFVSPRKGYACAYRVKHGGTGCSGFAKFAIREQGLIGVLPAIRARLAACRVAAEALRDEAEKRRKGKWYDYCDPSAACDPSCCGRGGKTGGMDGCDCQPDCCHL